MSETSTNQELEDKRWRREMVRQVRAKWLDPTFRARAQFRAEMMGGSATRRIWVDNYLRSKMKFLGVNPLDKSKTALTV